MVGGQHASVVFYEGAARGLLNAGQSFTSLDHVPRRASLGPLLVLLGLAAVAAAVAAAVGGAVGGAIAATAAAAPAVALLLAGAHQLGRQEVGCLRGPAGGQEWRVREG